MTSIPISNAARLLRECAEEIKSTCTAAGEWCSEAADDKAAYEERIAAANLLEAIPRQCLHQIQEPPTKTEALAHYSQQAILAMSEAGGQDALPLAAYLCIEESGAIDFEVLPPCTLPPGEYDLYAKSRTTQAAQQGGDKQ